MRLAIRPAARYAGGVPTDYRICCWRVAAEMALPGLWPWDGDDRPPQVTIRFGPVPDLADPVEDGPILQVGRDRAVRLVVGRAARIAIRGGRDIVVDPAASDAADWPAFLPGPVLAVLALQRGLLPLIASAVTIGGRGAALVGPSAAGKSTLAAALVARGHRLAADAVAVIDLGALGGPLLLPGLPLQALWEDSIEALGIGRSGLGRDRQDRPRYRVPVAAFDPAPVRLDRLYLVESARGPDQDAITPVDGPAAADRLRHLVAGGRAATRIVPPIALNDAVIRLSAAVPARRLPLWAGIERLPATAARIEADMAPASPQRRRHPAERGSPGTPPAAVGRDRAAAGHGRPDRGRHGPR